ncbi:hypothetical protein FEQ05_04373 [Burkholderia pseudomultivorans]|uniref:Uncharacterized protein n=1 Tax=Burkholderia pseudomultivorans TaxID=1207504 RepID=A0ABU2EB35_9BURK|nr:hypothetical protein [Burkholderia pseudomultivorans]MDR8738519.1 hypothetical protein [Burkholderia pseudomultivorans]MDR8744932.1 hypothetical protein [Burkholderia pseudomultivorans]MDR8756818.1 hypothetical protein [Burkholderia pseudomultivorans]MDR8781391.1 hypothetical protein [Burkholderia pseudomultivorans]
MLMGRHLRTELMLRLLDMALAQYHAKGVINHSEVVASVHGP